LTRQSFGYDAASRLETVTSGTNSASYTYLANSPLVDNIAFKNNGTTCMTTTKTYDYLNRLTAIASSGTGILPVSFNYAYRAIYQTCKPRCALGRFFAGEDGYWANLASSPNWKLVKGIADAARESYRSFYHNDFGSRI